MFAIIILYFLLLLYYYYYYCVLLYVLRLSIVDTFNVPPEYYEGKKASWHILTKFLIAWPQEFANCVRILDYRLLSIRANPKILNSFRFRIFEFSCSFMDSWKMRWAIRKLNHWIIFKDQILHDRRTVVCFQTNFGYCFKFYLTELLRKDRILTKRMIY